MNEQTVDDLIRSLQVAGFQFSAVDLADSLWLARVLPQRTIDPRQFDTPSNETSKNEKTDSRESDEKSSTPSSKQKEIPSSNKLEKTVEGRLPRTSSGLASGSGGVQVKLPDTARLPDAMEMMKALRPFRRRIKTQQTLELDEHRTAEGIATTGICLPVFHPGSERWLDVALVIDVGASMSIWSPLVNDFTRLLERLGAFRQIDSFWLDSEAKKQEGATHEMLPIFVGSRERALRRHPLEVVRAGERRIIFLLSDCVSLGWRNRNVQRLLHTWSESNHIAIIHLLPRTWWKRTEIGRSSSVELRSSRVVQRNADIEALARTRLHGLISYVETRERQRIATQTQGTTSDPFLSAPVLELNAESLSAWTNWTTGNDGSSFAGHAFELAPVEQKISDDAPQPGEPFLTVATPIARKLANVMAVAPPFNLPLLRVIRETMLGGEATRAHEAEFLLGGLVTATKQDERFSSPDSVIYDFRTRELRQLFREAVPEWEARRIIQMRSVAHFLAERLNVSPTTFTAYLSSPSNHPGALSYESTLESEPFAEFTTDTLQWLGGDFVGLMDSKNRDLVQTPHAGQQDVPAVASDQLKTKKTPSLWVLVAGTEADELPSRVLDAAERLGRELAEQDCGLVTNGTPGVAYVVARSFAEAIQDKEYSLDDWIVSVVEQSRTPGYAVGRIDYVENSIDVRVKSTSLAEGLILMGGDDLIESLGRFALSKRVPVFPLAFAEGASARLHQHMLVQRSDYSWMALLQRREFLMLEHDDAAFSIIFDSLRQGRIERNKSEADQFEYPGSTVWYLEASTHFHEMNNWTKEDYHGSAVLIRLKEPNEIGLGRPYLVTCASVINGVTTFGAERRRGPHRDVHVWPPNVAREKHPGMAARVSKMTPQLRLNQSSSSQPMAGNDWVLLEVSEHDLSEFPFADSWTDEPEGELTLWAYSGVEPSSLVQPKSETYRLISSQSELLSLAGPVAPRSVAGGGLFDTQGNFAGIFHSNSLKIHHTAINSTYIREAMRQLGYEVVTKLQSDSKLSRLDDVSDSEISRDNLKQFPVFMSYASVYEDIASQIRDYLREEGFHFCSFERLPKGKDWETATSDSIAGSKVVLFIGSEKSIRSRHLRSELEMAIRQGKPIVPIVTDSFALPREIRSYQAIQFANKNNLVDIKNALLNIFRGTRKDSVNLSNLVEEVVSEFQRKFGWLKAELAIAPEIYVVGNVPELRPAISKLVENAFKFSYGRQPISIRLARDNDTSHLTIENDSQYGLPGHEDDQLFGKWFQGESRVSNGLSAGLWLANRATNDHGGSISYKQNRTQRGIRISCQVRLPIAKQSQFKEIHDESVGPKWTPRPFAIESGRVTQDLNQEDAQQLAKSIVVRGFGQLKGVAHVAAGRQRIVGTKEIKQTVFVSNLLVDYCQQESESRPLCLGIFGRPGTGKSFLVDELLKSSAPLQPQILEFNLAQFAEAADLHSAFRSLSKKCEADASRSSIAVAVFEEFDCMTKGGSNGWIPDLLGPMQSGMIQSGSVDLGFRRCVLVFVSGKHASYEAFVNGHLETDQQNNKVLDFASRLRGYIDVPSLNGNGTDRSYMIRRAISMRQMFESMMEMGDNELLQIEDQLLTELLNVHEFRMEHRSISRILKSLSANPSKIITSSDLPELSELAILVDDLSARRLLIK